MKKPSWLKKDFPDKPWKYPIEIQAKEKKVIADTYNFKVDVDKGSLEVRKAMKWIDEHTKQEWKMVGRCYMCLLVKEEVSAGNPVCNDCKTYD